MLGLQLYTIRNTITDKVSAENALAKIKDMGYECVQLAGDISTIELTASAAQKAGLSVLGILISMDMCEAEEEKLFELARLYGVKDIGISSQIKTEDQAYDIIKRANSFAKKTRKNGISFSYHNHSNEFIRGNSGKTLMQLLQEGLDCRRI